MKDSHISATGEWLKLKCLTPTLLAGSTIPRNSFAYSDTFTQLHRRLKDTGSFAKNKNTTGRPHYAETHGN
ncbi:hypothetical protein ABEB36_009319 [Hypothenemus hampei]|uniref:Uncharacterized protein n=1 Tax=Hypothenemus hampei TaxID=57062 RepID=A0ABD1EFY7_HYPHA